MYSALFVNVLHVYRTGELFAVAAFMHGLQRASTMHQCVTSELLAGTAMLVEHCEKLTTATLKGLFQLYAVPRKTHTACWQRKRFDINIIHGPTLVD